MVFSAAIWNDGKRMPFDAEKWKREEKEPKSGSTSIRNFVVLRTSWEEDGKIYTENRTNKLIGNVISVHNLLSATIIGITYESTVSRLDCLQSRVSPSASFHPIAFDAAVDGRLSSVFFGTIGISTVLCIQCIDRMMSISWWEIFRHLLSSLRLISENFNAALTILLCVKISVQNISDDCKMR